MTTVRTAERRRDQAGEPLALYVHWPFCLSKCPYCDFNSHVREQIDQTRWRKALLAEIDHYAAIAPGRRLTSIFFGGGTPSLMPPETASAIIAHACKHWQAEAGLEITLEANPTSVETERLAHFRDAGINRISIGVQALDDKALAFLGRQHSHAQALAAIDAAATLFDSYSFDLIYARPGQTPQAWEQELARAVELARDHLSLYQLTIEPGTAFHTRFQRGQFTLPDEDTAATLFEITQIRLAAAGLPLMRSPTTPPPVVNAGTTWSIGVMASMSASDRAPMGACASMASPPPPNNSARPRPGWRRWNARVTAQSAAKACPPTVGSKKR